MHMILIFLCATKGSLVMKRPSKQAKQTRCVRNLVDNLAGRPFEQQWRQFMTMRSNKEGRLMRLQIAKDLAQMNVQERNQTAKREIRNFLIKSTQDDNKNVSSRAIEVLTALNRYGVWIDRPVINVLLQALFTSDLKIAGMVVHVFLGTAGVTNGEAQEEPKAKRVWNKRKRRLELKGKKQVGDADDSDDASIAGETGSQAPAANFQAIDLVNDPHGLAQQLMGRINTKNKDPFAYKVLLLQLVSRLVGRRLLLLQDFYPQFVKWLHPKSIHLPALVPFLAESVHRQVPHTEFKCVIDHIVCDFIRKEASKEAMEIGVIAIHQLVLRSPRCLDADTVEKLCEYKQFKVTGVSSRISQLIKVLREKNRGVLPEAFRKERTGHWVKKLQKARN
eukprot:gnl/MRDRNA2_/MRDRNA2_125881_c0_seq1.p1 gnl/MRDRNA2_/MRDRNA2_125881_c0~~gnl/MRDRNA2_/MRDRNA2_125881_c0_seq1.p1  ORF type:complete len:391 (-),score=71.29 gnl/MRDRNA2_/MRDRNA2_125881_c0_seq1:116-1288(-)